jgi:uncharacterized PurR-regulated membrane protein YhhQ (DUF165 family)
MEQRTVNKSSVGIVALVGYIATIFAANWAIVTFGIVPVGFGLMAPAGVYFVGLAFTLRDAVQEYLGKRYTVLSVVAGASLSVLISPHFALASGVAFLLSELADFAVYTPLRAKSWLAAVLASNVVGLAIDSALFLYLAFGSLDFLIGQIVGKGWTTLLAVVLIASYRRARMVRA